MSRRVPITEGRHRPEVVVDRLVGAAITELQQIRELEHNVADLPSVLSRLDAVVAAVGDAKATAQAEVVAEVETRVAALEAALGVAPPADPGVDAPQ